MEIRNIAVPGDVGRLLVATQSSPMADRDTYPPTGLMIVRYCISLPREAH